MGGRLEGAMKNWYRGLVVKEVQEGKGYFVGGTE